MGFQGERTGEWFDRGRKALVNGVSSGFRYWGDEDTFVIDRGEGAYVFDMDGSKYIDYQLGFGPIILGHGHAKVADAVGRAAHAGTTFAMTTATEIEAAEKVVESVGYIDGMRFTNTGTEATMHALRLARAYTGRELFLKFEGSYHGAHDAVLFSTAGQPVGLGGSLRSLVPVQASSGIPHTVRDYVRMATFNDLESVERIFRDEGHRISCMMIEPILGNGFGIEPEPGFLEGLRRICDEYGTVMIFDEVKTGFRVGLGGAEELYGVTPDLGTFAKSMGNGFPAAAIGGKHEIMQSWAKGGVTQAGTYSGNGVAAAAVSATIDALKDEDAFAKVEKVGGMLKEGLTKICEEKGVPTHVVGHPSMVGVFFGEDRPTTWRDKANHDADLYSEVVARMIGRGVLPVDDALEPLFLSAAHTEEDIATTLQAFEESLTEAIA